MDILIISQYLRNIEKLEGNNSRFIYLAELLGKDPANQVEILTSDFMHGPKRHAKTVAKPEHFRLTALEEPGYPKNVCLKRFQSHAALARNVKKYLRERKKPDCIYCAVPSLDVAAAAAEYCARNAVRFIVDVQDLWPEAFKMVLNVPVISNLAFYPMQRKANRIYAQADEIVAVSGTYCNRVQTVNRKAKKVHPVFLGTRLEDFDGNVKENPPVLPKPEGQLWLGYCGSLGHSYDLTGVIDALELMYSQTGSAPRLIVMGDGPKKEEFEAYAAEKKLDVIFTGRLDYGQMCSQLCQCDFVVNPIVGSSAASIINKHADYAACGRPVLNTQNSPEYRKLVDDYGMGFNCENGNAQDLADNLRKLTEYPGLRAELGRNARRCAEECFDRKNTYLELVKLIIHPQDV